MGADKGGLEKKEQRGPQEQRGLQGQGSSQKQRGSQQPKVVEELDLEERIVRCVEYYFDDNNLRKDKFMKKQIKIDDGWIPMSVMMKFRRLNSLCSDPKQVAELTKKLSIFVHVDMNSEEPRLRRSPQFPLRKWSKRRSKDFSRRSVFCGGISLDSTMDEIMEFLRPYSPEHVTKSRVWDKKLRKSVFNGSIFIAFHTKEEAKIFLELPTLKYKGKETTRFWKREFLHREAVRALQEREAEKRKNYLRTCKIGGTIHLSGNFLSLTPMKLKAELKPYNANYDHIIFEEGDDQVFIRFRKASMAFQLARKLGAFWQIGEAKLQVRVISAEEEETLKNELMELDYLDGKKGLLKEEDEQKFPMKRAASAYFCSLAGRSGSGGPVPGGSKKTRPDVENLEPSRDREPDQMGMIPNLAG